MTSPSTTTAATPDLWRVSETSNSDDVGALGIQDREGYILADVWADIEGREAEARANARLIAAAPTMAEALVMILERSSPGSDIANIARAALNLTAARSAITEAETPREAGNG